LFSQGNTYKNKSEKYGQRVLMILDANLHNKEGVRYTALGPADLEPVINALDNPIRVSREAKN